MRRTRSVATALVMTAAWWQLMVAGGLAAAQGREVDFDDLVRNDPAAAAVLDLPRDSAAAQLRAILALLDLGHADAAASLLADLAASEVSDQQKADLVDRYGTARLLRLLRQTGPGGVAELPAGREFVAATLQAASDRARDPQRLAAAIAQLAGAGPTRRDAQKQLVAAGEAGILAAVARLADEPPIQVRAALLETLAAMRPTVHQPVIALLAESDATLRRDAMRLAGRLHLLEALPWIAVQSLGAGGEQDQKVAYEALAAMDLPRPTPTEATVLIRRRLADLSQAAVPGYGTSLPESWWTFNKTEGRLETLAVTPQQARALRLARLAEVLAAAGMPGEPEDLADQLLYAWEAAAATEQRPDPELLQRWQDQPAEQLTGLLETALQRNLYAAARHAAELLGEQGDASVLTSLDGRPRPLAAALKSPDDEVRFEALQAILKIHPETSFAGASYVADSLWYFAAGGGDPTALAAAGTLGRANLWAGQLRSLGYDAVAASTGREALARVADPTRAARLAMVLIDSEVSLPGVREVVFQIRRNAKTGRAPIAILCGLAQLDEMTQLAEGDPWTIAEPRPHGAAAMSALLERLAELPAPELPPDDVRLARARFALQSIARLLASDATSDQLRRDVELAERALYQAELTTAAMEVLEQAGTTGSQRALLDYLSAGALPIESRQAAAEAFRQSVEQFGVQLPPDAIARQYDRYNASANAESTTQAMLGQVLDVIEGK